MYSMSQFMGDDRFDFLYLEDTLSKDERTEKMDVAIKAFFNDKQE